MKEYSAEFRIVEVTFPGVDPIRQQSTRLRDLVCVGPHTIPKIIHVMLSVAVVIQEALLQLG